MKADLCHFLIIDKGDPYRKSERIQLQAGDALIGRAWKTSMPDIVFDCLFISRRHAIVRWTGAGYLLEDLQSKHGTQINGIALEPNRTYRLNDGDQITLARGMVTMAYKQGSDFDDRTITLTNIFHQTADVITIDLDRREVRIAGEVLSFSGKERDLLLLLYRNKNKAVSYEAIKSELWPERSIDPDTIPDVGNEEINALVYRLRKRLGKYGNKIVTVTRYGIILEECSS